MGARTGLLGSQYDVLFGRSRAITFSISSHHAMTLAGSIFKFQLPRDHLSVCDTF